MTSKKARLRKPQGGNGVTLSNNNLSRAQRKVATAKRVAFTQLQATTAAKAATAVRATNAVVVPVVRPAPMGKPLKRVPLPPKKEVKK